MKHRFAKVLLVTATILLPGCRRGGWSFPFAYGNRSSSYSDYRTSQYSDYYPSSYSDNRSSQSSGNNSSSSSNYSSDIFPTGELTNYELEKIILKAVEMERKYMSSAYFYIEYSDSDNYTINVKSFRDGYDLFWNSSIQMVSYYLPDYSHFYFRTSTGQGYSEVQDSLDNSNATSYTNSYIYVFGGLYGIKPAAFVAFSSGMCKKNVEFDPYDAFCEKENNNYIITFNVNTQESIYWTMKINYLGELLSLQYTTSYVSCDVSLSFDLREDPPEEMVDLFAPYI